MLNQLIRLIKLEHPADHPEQAHEPACTEWSADFYHYARSISIIEVAGCLG